MQENHVIIYSNGIADFQRRYPVAADAPRQISIPVRQDHLADVLASFNVFGDVKLESPPTFRPSNERKKAYPPGATKRPDCGVNFERP